MKPNNSPKFEKIGTQLLMIDFVSINTHPWCYSRCYPIATDFLP